MCMHCSPGKIALIWVKFLVNATNSNRTVLVDPRMHRIVQIIELIAVGLTRPDWEKPGACARLLFVDLHG